MTRSPINQPVCAAGSTTYRGRFAPSPSGPLHRGSICAALASYLDARAHQGQWLLRIEDIDSPRTVDGAEDTIKKQLSALGMHWDEAPVRQTQRLAHYRSTLHELDQRGLTYRCYDSRKARQHYLEHPRSGERVYPGTWRDRPPPPDAAQRRFAIRLKVPDRRIVWTDRLLGPQAQNVFEEVGDVVVVRADGFFAYQFVVVVDDGLQGITHIVRGQDLASSTARQLVLAEYLQLPAPRYLHVPLILDEHGQKLSKQNHAPAVSTVQPLDTLMQAWKDLGFAAFSCGSAEAFLGSALSKWSARFGQRN